MVKLNCIMLIDDNSDDNFFHERVIKRADCVEAVIIKQTCEEALEYLRSNADPYPELIFLDINMPGMNGWDFMEEYSKLSTLLHRNAIIVMLTTSSNPDDIAKAKATKMISRFESKPLTQSILCDIIHCYFPTIE